jgi:hypothetical protein
LLTLTGGVDDRRDRMSYRDRGMDRFDRERDRERERERRERERERNKDTDDKDKDKVIEEKEKDKVVEAIKVHNLSCIQLLTLFSS